MSKSTSAKRAKKPDKPYDGFPLFAHATGRWAKKVRGKLHYFGPWSDPEAAVNKWLDQRDELRAGRTPRPKGNSLALKDLCNSFLTQKQQLLASGELAPRTFDRYFATCTMLINSFGKDRPVDDLVADDFQNLRAAMAKRWGPVALGNEIQNVRCVFRYGHENGLLDKPIRFGSSFNKPSAKVLRVNRAANGPRLFTQAQIHKLLKAASPNLKAMVLLGLNAGLGNTDLGMMPMRVLDLKRGWLDYARAKTAIPREIPLWPETVKALKAVLAKRPSPKDAADVDLVFIGARGESYVGNHKGYRVTQAFDRLAADAGVLGRTFYDLRRTFQTVAEGAHDLVAVQSIMGHAAAGSDMSAVYRQRVDDDRLLAVTNHVRTWAVRCEESEVDLQAAGTAGSR